MPFTRPTQRANNSLVDLATIASLSFALLACAACGGSDTTAPVGQDKEAQVNALLSEISAGQQAASASVSSGGSPTTPSSSESEDAGECPIDLASESFKCPTRTLPNGMTMSGYFQLLDAAGKPQFEFDSATTSAIRMVTDMSGTVQEPLMTQDGPVPSTQTRANHDDLTLSGLRSGARELNGTGTMSNTIAPQGMPTATMTATVTFAHLTFPKGPPTEGAFYPLSGTITSVITSKTGDQPTITTNQVTTYDGTAIAKTVITLPNGSKVTCTYDMSKPPGSSPPNCSGP